MATGSTLSGKASVETEGCRSGIEVLFGVLTTTGRNPLSKNKALPGIKVHSTRSSGPAPLTEERRSELLDDILRQALRASKIVKNLLDFSRAETTGFNHLNLSEILAETIRIAMNQIIISNVRLHEKIATDLPEIKGNRQGLQQVFLNIITNAVQSMKNGGDLTIRVISENDNKIIVSIQDTGTGIPEEHLPNIFDPFFTTKEVGKGTGLGLSVSFGIIKKHGGQILVESKVNKGTTFTVVFPVFKNKDHG